MDSLKGAMGVRKTIEGGFEEAEDLRAKRCKLEKNRKERAGGQAIDLTMDD